MSGELVAQLNATDFYRETSVGYDPVSFSAITGLLRGISLPKLITAQLIEYYNAFFVIPANLTLSTGLTFQFRLVDDGSNSADLGTNVVIGASVWNVDKSGFLTNLTADTPTEVTATVTLSSTAGNPAAGSIAIPSADIPSVAVGDDCLIRIRRIGDNASDTCQGRVILINGYVKNT